MINFAARGTFIMLPGFNKIVEDRVRKAQKEGAFENLAGSGKPLVLGDDRCVPEDLRLAYKILKNADCLPPELELKKEIKQTEDLLTGMEDTTEKYRTLKKLNFLILKLNSMRKTSISLDMPQQYESNLIERFGKNSRTEKRSPHSDKNKRALCGKPV